MWSVGTHTIDIGLAQLGTTDTFIGDHGSVGRVAVNNGALQPLSPTVVFAET
jgi:hypothetical protein